MLKSNEIDKILPAIARVKEKLIGVTKSANNPFYKSRYADLNTHLDEVEPLLKEEGLVLLQPPVTCGENNTVESLIFHVSSGQFIGASMNLVGESDMQKAGSAVTYGRRYTLGGLLAIKSLDDDGNEASGKTVQKSNNQKQSESSPTKSESGTTKSSGFRNRKKSKPETPVASGGEDW